MADEDKRPADMVRGLEMIAQAPASAFAIPGDRPTLPVKDIRVIATQAKSPANEFVDIVEIELALPNDGNCDWMQWMDCLRLRCEHGKADGLLKAMGIKNG